MIARLEQCATMGGMLSLSALIEATLFASGDRMEKGALATLLSVSRAEIDGALTVLAESLTGRGLTLVQAGEYVELRTAAEAAATIKKLRESELARDLGKASLETLAVIAYRKSATRSDVDWVRGVNSSASMRTLLLRGLIEGREDEADKRRIRYTLTTEALAHLGLARPEDLPRYDELALDAKEALRAELAG
ncbi:SMC-Scp complex subunit ScpB [Candidatus Kaiserbacteria bacterium CG10_big_fil_rev_8_21_14_0_10_56_12]|uniref:SMC-Scp complex subunit ScpB n=1 Tax=Candidatus Kaiserbacteria bacterium CG10_big_fil_rev_8_21_14_0_10_56_12 TaxID=1974611 RepID=A0A2H0UAD0_9BACT|nr:MAG: SMC-Scp complex subunit ScpB [Candidatus Kaiserbacteria bacterium CG10_big_fil_rev_8_21_14_0_10_56_12]